MSGRCSGDRTLAAVAQARDDVLDLLTVRLGEGSNSRRKIARALITGVLDEAVRAGKITMHRCDGIALPITAATGIVMISCSLRMRSLSCSPAGPRNRPWRDQAPLTIWLMRGCGLRIEEAFAVQKSCFRDGGTVLRVFEQASRDGPKTMPLKHRKAGEYRDIPVPAYLWEIVKDLPDGYLFMADGDLPVYGTYRPSFQSARAQGGHPGGIHAAQPAACVRVARCSSRGVPITDVAAWLGHRNINVTYATYGHLVPSSAQARPGRAECRVRGMEQGCLSGS